MAAVLVMAFLLDSLIYFSIIICLNHIRSILITKLQYKHFLWISLIHIFLGKVQRTCLRFKIRAFYFKNYAIKHKLFFVKELDIRKLSRVPGEIATVELSQTISLIMLTNINFLFLLFLINFLYTCSWLMDGLVILL
jgi:hypothetical protein